MHHEADNTKEKPMNRSLTRFIAYFISSAAAFGAASVHAQTQQQTGALSQFANNTASNATVLQQQAAYGVQGMCSALALEGGLRLTGSKGDLFQRCNEMVETARVFEGIPLSANRALGYSDRAQLLGTVQQVSGEELTAQGKLSTQVSAGQFANISGRLNALRLGGAASAARGHVAMLGEPMPTGLAMLDDAAQSSSLRPAAGASSDSEVPNPWGWFIESSYGFGDHDQTANEDAFDFDSVSVSTGSDYNFGNGVIGFSIGYDDYKADFDTSSLVSGGDVKVEGVSGSLFAGYFGGGWTVNGIATYGQLSSDVNRRVVYESLNAACNPSCGAQRTVTGSPDGDYIALGATIGYEFNAGGWDITPTLSASYRDVSIDGYDERDTFTDGGLALRYEDQTIKSTRSIVGIALSRPISRSFGVLVPSLRAEWHHEFEDDVRQVRAKYVLEDSLTVANASDPHDFACVISCFTMLSDQPDTDFGIASIGVSSTFAQRMQFYLIYEALISSENLSSNSIAAGLRGQF
jgi:outer membrane autotransporter protein